MNAILWGWFSLAIALVSYIPYTLSIISGRTKPHAFSWFVWAFLTAIAFFAQLADNAGPGAWATGFTAVCSVFFTILAVFCGEKNIARSDWITFLAALGTIPIWYVMKDPLWAVVLITIIDALAFYPTFRKSWHKPQEEMTLTFSLSALKFGVALLALENTTWTTALYPWSLVIMNGAFVVMVWYRRRYLKAQTSN